MSLSAIDLSDRRRAPRVSRRVARLRRVRRLEQLETQSRLDALVERLRAEGDVKILI